MAVSFGPMTIIWLAVKTLGSLFVMACVLRAYLQAVRLHSQNPLSRLTFQMTDWVVLPIRRLVPGFGGVDWASVLASLLARLDQSWACSDILIMTLIILLQC
jgi:YggT family protein